MTVPIEVLTENNPPQGLAVQKIIATPAEVRILIPRRLRGKRIRILTEPIDLAQLDVQKAFAPSLRYPPDIQFAGGKRRSSGSSSRRGRNPRRPGAESVSEHTHHGLPWG